MLDEYVEIVVSQQYVEKKGFTVYSTVDGNNDEWIQYRIDSILEYFAFVYGALSCSSTR